MKADLATTTIGSAADDATAKISDLSAYRSSQLDRTLVFLQEKSPYYRESLRNLNTSQMDPESILHRLPTLTAGEWGKLQGSLRTGPLDDVILGYTSGTTNYLPTPVLCSTRELEIHELLQAHGMMNAEVTQTGKTLILAHPYAHGAAGMTGFGDTELVHPLCCRENLSQIVLLLEHKVEPFASFPPITKIGGNLMKLKALSLYLLQIRGRMDDLDIKQIYVGRQILSPRWRSRLEAWWRAEVIPVYGFSEMRVCNAMECPECRYYHLPPSGMAEVLNEELSWTPVQPGGRGMLAITGFYPFVELEPRVRYMPGDLAQLSPTACPRWGEHGFLPLGRRKDSARCNDGTWVCPADVHAALADHPGVNRVLPPGANIEGFPSDEIASPRFRLESGDPILLHVELRFSPEVWMDEWRAMRSSIHKQLFSRIKMLPCDPLGLQRVADC
jgi:phenylacetate-coenzyme A ligase PaaK-like adenylate-forming protein